MRFAGRISRKWAGLASMAGLLALFPVSGCTSNRPAPIRYAAAHPGSDGAEPAGCERFCSRPARPDHHPVRRHKRAGRAARTNPDSECVPTPGTLSGIQIWGDAVTWWAQAANRYVRSTRPAPGSVLAPARLERSSTRGHVSAVTEIVSSRILRVDHANWLEGGEISLNVPVIDVSDANDWSKVRVWHVPGGDWGGRTYEVEGFIHPDRVDGAAFGG